MICGIDQRNKRGLSVNCLVLFLVCVAIPFKAGLPLLRYHSCWFTISIQLYVTIPLKRASIVTVLTENGVEYVTTEFGDNPLKAGLPLLQTGHCPGNIFGINRDNPLKAGLPIVTAVV